MDLENTYIIVLRELANKHKVKYYKQKNKEELIDILEDKQPLYMSDSVQEKIIQDERKTIKTWHNKNTEKVKQGKLNWS